MPVSPGTLLGPYEVVSPLGAGGMGEVYRARDTRLGRIVALKILPADVATDRGRLSRFIREAQAASALNHPHIVSVHDSGESGGFPYIAMELVEGEGLTAWVDRTGADLGRVLEVFLQLADALAIAHAAGIVHRDLKPANVLVTGQGYVKVVDFGLAKFSHPDDGQAGSAPTATATALGEVVGTVAYMSPEQALGRPVDARTDIFSFGVMLIEALTGGRPFERAAALDTLHAIVHDPAPGLPAGRGRALPAELGWVTGKCLAKAPDERYQSMRELAADLRRIRRTADAAVSTAAGTDGRGALVDAAPVSARRAGRPWTWALVCVLAGAALGAGLLALLWPRGDRQSPGRPLVSAVTQLTWDLGYEGEPSWAPDGRSLVYVADRGGNLDIYLSQVAGGPAVNLTNDPSDDVQPAFSPDGKQVAFVSSRRGERIRYATAESPRLGGSIFVMSALGGPARFIAEGNFPAWTPDGKELVFVAGGWFERRLFRIAVSGGSPKPIPVSVERTFDERASAGTSQDFLSPAVSPDGRFIAFEAVNNIYVVAAGGGPAVAITHGRGPAWTRSPLALVFTAKARASGESLWRLPISATDATPVGPAEPITVGPGTDVQAAVTTDGRLIAFAAVGTTSHVERITFDLDQAPPRAVAMPLTTGNDPIYFFHTSPDGRSILYDSRRTGGIWRMDEGRPAVELSLDPSQIESYPRWSPDGRRIVFTRRSRTGEQATGSLWVMAPDGGGARSLGFAAFNGFVSWTPDSRALVIQDPADRQIHVVDVDARSGLKLTDEPGVMPVTSVSRDGGWVAYQSTDNPQHRVVIRIVPLSGGPSRLVAETPENAYHPFFSLSGSWLYFTPDHHTIVRVPGPARNWRKAPPEEVITFRDADVFIEDPQPAGDGRGVLYARRRLASDLWVLTLER